MLMQGMELAFPCDDRVVAVGEAGSRTAAQLAADVHGVRAHVEDGHWRHSCVVVCGDRYWFLVALLAAWSKRCLVQLPPSGLASVVEALAAGSGVHGLLHDTCHVQGLDIRRCAAAASGTPLKVALPAGEAVLALHTSGTTGDADGVTKTAGQLLGEADMLGRHFGFQGLCFLSTVPSHHIYGLLFGILAPLRAGCIFVRETPLHALAVGVAGARWHADVLVSTPAHLAGLRVLQERPFAPSATFSSGAPLAEATRRDHERLFGHAPTEVFGSTETGGIGWRRGSGAWRPLPGVEVDADGDGCLRLRSAYAGQGEDWVTTADRVELSGDDGFVHLGRADRVVKIAGKRLDLDPLEELVRSMDGVDDAAAMGRPCAGVRGVEVLLAVASLTVDEHAVRRHLRERYDGTLVPRRLCVVDALPRGSTGKLPGAVLAALFEPVRPGRSPMVLASETRVGDGFVLDFVIPRRAWCFAGHFPDRPIFPGAGLLQYAVVEQVARLWPHLGVCCGVDRVKFSAVVEPGACLSLQLDPVGERRVRYTMERQGERCAAGTLLFSAREAA